MLENGAIAELLAREAENAKPPAGRALRGAATAALSWPEEAAQVAAAGRPLTELVGISPNLAGLIADWIDSPPLVEEIDDLRRNFLTMSQAKRILSEHTDWLSALHGDLHMHSEWSDGSGTIAEMAKAGQARGYEYIAITDHSKTLKIAGGIDEMELEEQGREIDELNATLRRRGETLQVLRSIELNVDVSGQGDMDGKALAKLDVVVGSLYTALNKTGDQTERYLNALKNPNLHILGSPRERIYNHRLGLKADWERVFATAAALDKALEVDCYPDRQDLDVELLQLAREAGAKISLGTDSHLSLQLSFIEFGLAAAILAKIPKERILNFLPREELMAWANKVRSAN